MNYNFNEIEAKWQKHWAEHQTFKASNQSDKEKFYVLDMFPYPSGAGLHVGHPLGYIASDIYARYKRHQGFNVLHPQGYDSFGLPAEQYAIQTGQHPAITTKTNIARYREQLDKIGFSFDWSREVRTSDPNYYKWTQWIFIQLFESWYDVAEGKAKPISALIESFAAEGNTSINAACDDDVTEFSAEAWKAFSEKEQQEILLKYRLTYLAETEVNWCPQLGTVLANDEIVNGVSERGGYPVVRKKMKQWSMRISAYAERLLQGLTDLDWTDSLKESQRNWIGKSVGAEVEFPILSFPKGEAKAEPGYMTGGNNSHLLIEKAQENRANPTEAEKILWEQLRSKKLEGYKFRQQHLIDDFIVDFVCLSKKLVVEVDGKIHETTKEYDGERTKVLEEKGFKVIRFKNEEIIGDLDNVLEKILEVIEKQAPLSFGEGSGDRISVFTTRPDTIFGVTFMTLAPEHELVSKITTPEQKEAVEAYVEATAKRSERERMADVKTISGVFTGAYAEHPFTKEPVPIWIGDYVLASYGTGAVMAVPCGDQRDFDFAKHFDIPIKNIFKDVDITEAAHADKEGTVITNSDFLNDLPYKKALKRAIFELEKIGQGKGKTNYRLRDAVFSRQRYWGEPFPVYYVNGMPKMIDAAHLPIELPEVEKYLPTEEGEPPLGRADVWAWDAKNNKVVPNSMLNQVQHDGSERHSELDSESHHNEIYPLELNTMPGWAGSSWYFFRYMEDEKRKEVFASPEALNYWQNVDLYIGGSEHATGHLLYARFWTKFLKDRGFVPVEEPFKKLINQGMILGNSAYFMIESYTLKFPIPNNVGELVEESKTYEFSISNSLRGNQIKLEQISESIYKNVINAKVHIDNLQSYVFDFLNGEDITEKYLVWNIEFNYCKNGSEFLYRTFFIGEDDLFFQASPYYSGLNLPEEICLKIIEKLEKLDFEKNNIINESISVKVNKLSGDYNLSMTNRPFPVPIQFIDEISNELDIESFKNEVKGFDNASFIFDKNFICYREVEKMSKSKYNVVNPDDICEDYGADTLRMYEMFLGPLEQAKPWNTAGITGVHNFLKKLWKLYHNGEEFSVTDTEPSKDSLKTLHKTIKKVTEDIEDFSFNTSVSTFMICVNELTAQKCTSKEILEPLAVLISPYAPHIAEELWSKLGNKGSVAFAPYPQFEERHLKESSKTYPISFNGKMRFTMDLSLDLSKDELEAIVMADERTKKQLDGAAPKKVIIVPGKIINIVK